MKNKVLASVLTLLAILALTSCESEFDEPLSLPTPGNPIIDIHSNPSADFQILRMSDGQSVSSGHTPEIGVQLAAGSYAVSFSKEGYQTEIQGLRLALGDTNIAITAET